MQAYNKMNMFDNKNLATDEYYKHKMLQICLYPIVITLANTKSV